MILKKITFVLLSLPILGYSQSQFHDVNIGISLGSLNENLTKDINHKATTKIARLSKKMNVKRFIFVSTQSVYGISKLKKKTIKEND